MRYVISHVHSPTFHFFFSFSFIEPSPPSQCHTPPPVFLSWGENMACTSGGDPDSPVGKGCQVKDTLLSVCIYLCVHVCLEGVMWSGRPNAADYKQLAGPASANRARCWSWHQEEGGALMFEFLYFHGLILICESQTSFFKTIYNILPLPQMCPF